MEKTREEFVTWILCAMHDQNSAAFHELYQFLVNCFVRADKDMTGVVTLDHFDSLIEEAAALPRQYGYAPVTTKLYPTIQERKNARSKQFNEITKTGQISLEQWIAFAIDHIYKKIGELPKDYLNASSNQISKEEFIDFMKKAVVKGTPENKQLYHFLFKVFQDGDTNLDGLIDPVEFDGMIEAAAAAPRRFGLAPKSEDMFPNVRARQEKRREYFRRMDKDNNGIITLDEWLNYAMEHICNKVACL